MQDPRHHHCDTARPRISGSTHEIACTWAGDRDDVVQHVLDLLPDEPLRDLLLEMLTQPAAV